MKIAILILIILLNLNIEAQDFKKLVDSTYDFIPHKMSKEEQQKIFPKLDNFFNLVIEDTSKYLPLLRFELNEKGHKPYFYYDGAHLLMMLNKDKTYDDNLIIKSFKKSDLNDLNPKVFTSLLTNLSLRGANTTDLAIEVLKDTNFSFYVPEHSLLFNQGYCISYILLPLDPILYTSKLIDIFSYLPDVSKKAVITTLWFSFSCKGDKFLNTIKENRTFSKEIIDYTSTLLSMKKVDENTQNIMSKLYGNSLDRIWIDSFDSFSDEAISNIDYVTRMRRQTESCR